MCADGMVRGEAGGRERVQRLLEEEEVRPGAEEWRGGQETDRRGI